MAQEYTNPPGQRYSILILGKAQTGKSALIQHIKNYADPTYAFDTTLLGNGNLSWKESAKPYFVESSLPCYEVRRVDTGVQIDL
ncbi:hypothetical protein CPB97_005840, partial [Podila verticillata]